MCKLFNEFIRCNACKVEVVLDEMEMHGFIIKGLKLRTDKKCLKGTIGAPTVGGNAEEDTKEEVIVIKIKKKKIDDTFSVTIESSTSIKYSIDQDQIYSDLKVCENDE